MAEKEGISLSENLLTEKEQMSEIEKDQEIKLQDKLEKEKSENETIDSMEKEGNTGKLDKANEECKNKDDSDDLADKMINLEIISQVINEEVENEQGAEGNTTDLVKNMKRENSFKGFPETQMKEDRIRKKRYQKKKDDEGYEGRCDRCDKWAMDKGLICMRCKKWNCLECEDLKQGKATQIQKKIDKEHGLIWICQDCRVHMEEDEEMEMRLKLEIEVKELKKEKMETDKYLEQMNKENHRIKNEMIEKSTEDTEYRTNNESEKEELNKKIADFKKEIEEKKKEMKNSK